MVESFEKSKNMEHNRIAEAMRIKVPIAFEEVQQAVSENNNEERKRHSLLSKLLGWKIL